nr:MAG TPA: hypothetical protein [Caudoviricetes sp.]
MLISTISDTIISGILGVISINFSNCSTLCRAFLFCKKLKFLYQKC